MGKLAKLTLWAAAAFGVATPALAGLAATPTPEVQGGILAFALMSAGYAALRRRR